MAGRVQVTKAMRPTMRLLSRRQVTTTAAVSVSTRHARSNQDASNENQQRVMVQIAGGAAALLLTAGIVAGSDAGGWINNAHCESLQRLDTSNRRHTGTTRKKSGAAERAEDYCPHGQEGDEEDGNSQVATTAYFDAEYETKSLIGAGTFGMVMQCVSKKDGHVAAVKMVQDLTDNSDEVAREKQALSSIQQSGGHEHIIRYDGSYSHNGFHYIVTEYVAGDSLFAFLEKRRRVDVRTALQLVAQLADALGFLQQSGIVHRDLKPENIMVLYDDENDDTSVQGEKLKLKIIDFGSAGTSPSSSSSDADGDEEELQEQPATISLSGTRCYWSPEVLQNQEMTPAMDMWSLGCLLYILISGRHPFDLMGSSSEEQIVQRVTTESVSFLHPVWMDVPQQIKELVRGLLEKDPHQRFSVDDVLTHSSILSASASASKKL